MRLTSKEAIVIVGAIRCISLAPCHRGRYFKNSPRRPRRQNTIHVSWIPSARSSATTFHFCERNHGIPKMALSVPAIVRYEKTIILRFDLIPSKLKFYWNYVKKFFLIQFKSILINNSY